jgi:hypothetical protein
LKDASLIKFEFYVLPALHYFFDVGQDNPIVVATRIRYALVLDETKITKGPNFASQNRVWS